MVSQRRDRHALLIVLVIVAVLASIVVPGSVTAESAGATPGVPRGSAAVLALGDDHSCVVLDDGAVKCWGENQSGQLGLGDTADRGVAGGQMGDDLMTVDLGVGRTAVGVTAGGGHTCTLLDDGAVKCWGRNTSGQLGLGDADSRGDDPGEMGDALSAVDLGAGRTAVAIVAGDSHTCALLDDAKVKCWGDFGYGQIGTGDTNKRGDQAGEMGDALVPVELGTGRTATAITAGSFHTCALLDDADVKCWGRNFFGELGLGDTEWRGDGPGEMGDALPRVDLGSSRSAVSISAGDDHSCAVLDDATVKCWGAGLYGQLGTGATDNRGDEVGEMGDALSAVDLGSGRSAISVTAGGSHTCSVLDDDTVKCWGNNSFGQLGQGDTADRGVAGGQMGDSLPAVALGSGSTAQSIEAGSGHSCSLLDDATVKCWGDNVSGQLGLGDTGSRGASPGDMGDSLASVDLGSGRTVVPVAATPGLQLRPTASARDAAAEVNWTEPADDGGSPIVGYRIEWSLDGSTWVVAVANTGLTTTHIVTGLTNSLTYRFRLAAINSVGVGIPTAPSDAVTPIGPPGPPMNVVGLAGDSEVAVTWLPPANDGGSPITGYTATATPNGATCATTSSLTCVVPGLTNGTAYTFVVTATNALGTGSASAPSLPVTPNASPAGGGGPGGSGGSGGAVTPTALFVPVTPFRAEDTRLSGIRVGSVDGSAAALRVKVTGSNGVPASGVDAVSLNVTVVEGVLPGVGIGFVTVDACASPRPGSSNLNFVQGQTVPNAVITPVTAGGEICVYVYGTAHVLVDVNGYFPTGSTFGSVTPFRAEDTRLSGIRVGSVDGSAAALRVKVTGSNGVPASGVDAVSLNVTVVEGVLPGVGIGFVTVDACASPRPGSSNLNFVQGQTVPNAVITPVTAGGEICVYVYGTAHVLVDVNGYFPTGSTFGSVTPFRAEDTRLSGIRVGSVDGSAAALRVKVTGSNGVPASGVDAVSLNVTVVEGVLPGVGIGFVTVDACASPRPGSSNLNFVQGQTVPNAVITPVTAGGEICVYVYGTAHVLVDVNGYFPTG